EDGIRGFHVTGVQTCALPISRPLVVSIAAGITSTQLDRWLGGNQAVVRTMPNTPALLGAGVTGLYANPRVDASGRARAERLLAKIGRASCRDSGRGEAGPVCA